MRAPRGLVTHAASALIRTFRVVFLLVPAATLVYAAAQFREVPAELDPDPVEVWSPTRTDEIFREGTVTLTLKYEPRTELVGLDLSGLVTSVSVSAGQPVESGDVLATIEGRPLVALVSERPFYRDLVAGESGEDVRELQMLLGDLGLYESPPDGKYGTRTARAVEQWRAAIGDPAPTREFLASEVVWLPADVEHRVVEAVNLHQGSPAPASGEWVVRFSRVLATVSMSANAEGTDLEFPAELSFDEITIGELDSPTLNQSQMDRLSDLVDSGQVRPAEDRAGTETASTSGQTIQLDGRVRSKASRAVVVMPASAVVHDSGTDCVWIRRDTGIAPHRLEVVGGSLGVVYAPSSNADIAEVLANPLEVLGSTRC